MSNMVNFTLRLLILAFVLLIANMSWGYAYDAYPDYSFSQRSTVALQKVEYDGTPNLCYRCIKPSIENLQEKALDGSFFTFEVGLVATKGLAGVPGRVQSRINLEKGGLKHTLDRHLNPASSGSQFSLSKGGVADLLQSKQVVGSPITRVLDSGNFLREVNVGRNIGFDKFNGNRATSTLSVITDKFGNLVTATPGKIK